MYCSVSKKSLFQTVLWRSYVRFKVINILKKNKWIKKFQKSVEFYFSCLIKNTCVLPFLPELIVKCMPPPKKIPLLTLGGIFHGLYISLHLRMGLLSVSKHFFFFYVYERCLIGFLFLRFCVFVQRKQIRT